MINRRKSKQISIGNIKIGGDAPISVQSMCNTDTRNVEATLDQIGELAAAGCEIVRLAVLNKDAAAAIKDIVKKSPVPLVADIHFDYSPYTIKEACKILREELLKHKDLYRAFSASIYSALNEMPEETWIDEMPEIILSRIIGEEPDERKD